MPIQRIKRKIADLRQQPEPVRIRAASIMTAVVGLVLAGLWVGVLLPVQLAFTRNKPTQLPEQELFKQVAETAPSLRQNSELPNLPGQVGGVRIESPTPTEPIFNLAPTPSPTPLPTQPAGLPTPSDSARAPVEVIE